MLTSEDTTFVCKEIQERVQSNFSIILSIDDAIAYIETRLYISCLASMDQTNYKPQLIYNSSVASDSATPSTNAYINYSTNL